MLAVSGPDQCGIILADLSGQAEDLVAECGDADDVAVDICNVLALSIFILAEDGACEDKCVEYFCRVIGLFISILTEGRVALL